MAPREHLARRLANEVLDELAITAAPVDPERIAREKGMLVEEKDRFPAGAYGALFRAGNRFGIIVSSTCPGEGHRRFTIAHELGHYHIPGHVESLLAPGDSVAASLGGHFRGRKDPIEVEADCFASELLLPDRFVRPFVRRVGHGLTAVRALAEQFRTSMSAAAIRYATVTGEPVLVVVSHDGTIEWTTFSGALWSYSWARRRMKRGAVPRGSATQRLALAPDRVVRSDTEDSSMPFSEWLEDAPAAVEVIEEAVGLGTFGRVLTLLRAEQLPDPDEEPDEDERETDWRDALRGYRLG